MTKASKEAVLGIPNPAPKMHRTGDEMRHVEYKCVECGEVDHGKFFPGEPIPVAIQCWNCHSGRGLQSAEHMVMSRKGMHIVMEEEETQKGTTRGLTQRRPS